MRYEATREVNDREVVLVSEQDQGEPRYSGFAIDPELPESEIPWSSYASMLARAFVTSRNGSEAEIPLAANAILSALETLRRH